MLDSSSGMISDQRENTSITIVSPPSFAMFALRSMAKPKND